MQNIIKVYGGDLVSKIFAVGMILILIRGMTQEDYANYISFSALAAVFISVVGSGINFALIRFSTEYISTTGKKPYSLYFLSLVVQIAFFLFLLLCVLVFPTHAASLLLGKPELAYLLPISMMYGLGSILVVSGQSIVQAEERFNIYISILILRQGLVFMIVVCLWLFRSLGFQWVAWGVTASQLIVGIGVVAYSFVGVGKIRLQQIIKQDIFLVRQFLSASGWLIAYFIILALFIRMDVLMLTRFSSATELANYGVAFQYYSLALLLLGSISAVLIPKFSHIEMQNPIRQHQFLNKWLRYTVWVGIPVFLFITFGKPIYIFVNGIQYENSFNILAILSIGVWLSLMLSPLINIVMSRKEFKFLFLIAMCAFLSSLVFFYIGIQHWGGLGAAVVVILVHNVVLQIPILLKVKVLS